MLEGLKLVHERPELIATDRATVGLWFVNDDITDKPRTDSTMSKSKVIRICKEGDDLHRSPLQGFTCALHVELNRREDDEALLDLSIFGTPPGKSDEDLGVRKNREGFYFTTVDKVVRLGNYRHEIGESLKPGTPFHVFIYFATTKMDIVMHVVYAEDGHYMSGLRDSPIQSVVSEGRLLDEWTTHNNSPLTCAVFGQIVRPECAQVDDDTAVADVRSETGEDIEYDATVEALAGDFDATQDGTEQEEDHESDMISETSGSEADATNRRATRQTFSTQPRVVVAYPSKTSLKRVASTRGVDYGCEKRRRSLGDEPS